MNTSVNIFNGKHKILAMKLLDTPGSVTNECSSTNRSKGRAYTSMASTRMNMGSPLSNNVSKKKKCRNLSKLA